MKRRSQKSLSETKAVIWLIIGVVHICVAAAIERAGGLASTNPWIWVTFPATALCAGLGIYGLYRFFDYGESTGKTSYVQPPPYQSKSWSALHRYLDRQSKGK